MHLQAILTVGWHEPPQQPFSAPELHTAAKQAEEHYHGALARMLNSGIKAPGIFALERLFRRCPGGFGDLKAFIGALSSLPGQATLSCQIDGFAYAFLKGAKNIDFFLPEAPEDSPFRAILPKWNETITTLEDFERLGQPLPARLASIKDDYLHLRQILARKSARDERRSLATLLVNGPSTLADLTKDLGLNYTLSQRVLAVFINSGIVKARTESQYVIREDALPIVLFCLRETMGVDPLKSLQPAEV